MSVARVSLPEPSGDRHDRQKEAASPPLIFRHAAHATGAGKAAGPGLPPRCARRANPAVAGTRGYPDARAQLNWRSTVTRKRKITNLGWCQGSSEADPSRIK